ncbi:MAG: hypothetical protein IK128_01715 [Clostridiales bacterium]|nr:hypothetical protein [Clostridiales bacterium]
MTDRPVTTLFMLMSVDGKISTGRVQAKMGVNNKDMPAKTPVSFVLMDNHHLTEHGVRYFCALSARFVLKLIECKVLEDSYIRLRYEVVKD